MWNITKHLQEHIAESDTVLDVACGKCDPTKDLKARVKVGVDLYRPSLNVARKHCIPLNMDVRDLRNVMLPGTFDVVLWLDGMEHLEVNDSMRVLEALEGIAKKRIIIHIPQEFFTNEDGEGFIKEGELQRHRSHFPLEFFTGREYTLLKSYASPGKHASHLVMKEF